MRTFTVVLPTALQSKSNFTYSAGTKKQFQALKAYEQAVGLLAYRALPDDWDLGDADLPLAERPEVLLGVVAMNSNYDSANFTKSVADALEGVLYINDKSATTTLTRSLSSADASPAHAIVAVQIDPDASGEAQLEALNELSRLVLEVSQELGG